LYDLPPSHAKQGSPAHCHERRPAYRYAPKPPLFYPSDGDFRDEISKDVSSMANSAGGKIIYGLSGDPTNRWLRGELDPVERSSITTESLQQIILSRIQPKIIHDRARSGGLTIATLPPRASVLRVDAKLAGEFLLSKAAPFPVSDKLFTDGAAARQGIADQKLNGDSSEQSRILRSSICVL
jgi:hypothetical protein